MGCNGRATRARRHHGSVGNPQLGDDGAAIHASITVDAAEPVDDRITLSLRPEGFRGGGTMERAHVEAAAGERVVVERRIDVRDPKFWWPRGFGSQHRYAVHAKLGEQERVATTGFSRITYDEDGLLVNGRSVPARGSTSCRVPIPGRRSSGHSTPTPTSSGRTHTCHHPSSTRPATRPVYSSGRISR
ncbi:hypothetical protein ACFQH2_15525 [Natronoarchaeum sp. GCM10025703]|uniref:hypothetical protein n=1 Tax=Natronoarchaeum sp. GCM10025703 TaxID=3252685 RepID=UPI00360723F8